MAKPKLIEERGRGEKASGRGLVPATSQGAKDVPYNAYLQELNPRQSPEIQFALAASGDVRFHEFLERLDKPAHKNWSLATIAKSCDISLPQFHQFWQDAQKNIALARAQSAIPNVIADMAQDARSKKMTCSRCDGYGHVTDNSKSDDVNGNKPLRICPNCKGEGEVLEVGNTHARDKLLEVTGMVKKGGGAAVQITQNFGGMGIESAVDRMSAISFNVDDEDVIDVTTGE
jgi:hypothetical protein